MRLNDTDPAPWLAIGFVHIETFLALVREGSVTRAARSLGLGHSTASAQIKLVTDCFGQRFFARFPGGLTPTRAGLDAYAALAPLMIRARTCLDAFRADHDGASLPVALPQPCPGTFLERAVARLAERLSATPRPALVLPVDAASAEPSGLGLSFGSLAAASASSCRDRWLLVRRAGTHVGWAGGALDTRDLQGLTIQIPLLPDALTPSIVNLADKAKAALVWTHEVLPELLARSAQSQSFCALMPASLFNPAWAGPHFTVTSLVPGDFDPVVEVTGKGAPAALLRDELARTLSQDTCAALDAARLVDDEAERLSLKHCRSLLALYEEANVRRAAERLCIVQPALTVQLHRIEEQAGCRLFTRASSGLKANESAARLYGIVRALVSDLDETLERLRAADREGCGRVRIGLMPALDDESLTAEAFTSALDQWIEARPDRFAHVAEGYSSTLVTQLRAGKFDFVLVDRVVDDPDLIVDRLAEDPMAVLVDKVSGLLPPGPVTLDQLANLPLILPSNRHGLRTLLADHLAERGFKLQPRMEIDSMSTTLSLVKTGRYAAVLPISAIHKSTIRRRLAVHEIRDPHVLRTICLVRLRNGLFGADTRELVDRLNQAFSTNGLPSRPPERADTASKSRTA